MGVSKLKNTITSGSSKLHTGLNKREVRKRLAEYGPNIITSKKKVSVFKIFLSQFTEFITIILLISTLISMIMGEMTEAVAIITIVIVNGVLGFIQEYRTERTLDALKELAAPVARVIREGQEEKVPASEIVPGDLILLETGDRIPADSVLVECNSIQVDESLLTGESVPVAKSVDAGRGNSKSGTKRNSVYMGTVVTNGRALASVYSTGMYTEMGKIADMIQSIEDEQTPLQKRLDNLGKYIVYGCLAICGIVTVTGILRGEELFTMLLAGISLAVAAIPEGLPAIVTIALALGVQRMLKRNALVRKLPAVETLGCANVVCSDKTGTLTENRMTVRSIYVGERLIEVWGDGDSLYGDFKSNGRDIEPLTINPLKLALEIGSVCNNAKVVVVQKTNNFFGKVRNIISGNKKLKISGDPTEGAILVAASKAGLTEDKLFSAYSRIDELPFDSNRKCMSVVCDNYKGEVCVFTKGAPDVVIKKCNKAYNSHGVSNLTPLLKNKIMEVSDSMASDALRVLGVAYKKLNSTKYQKNGLEEDLIFVGLIGMIDPPRKEVKDSVRKCRSAGIKPVMITGDHKNTASAIAKELDICREGDIVLTGSELDKMDEREFTNVAGRVCVYARVSPKHKLFIVKALKKMGNIVAMTGDGVNDAPAVKEADIGVSMGITGTDVTKEASSMILMDDNFATIVGAIEEGRVIYNNIRKFIRYLLSCNIGEVLTMFLGMLVGLPIPLLPIQILWVNLVTDGLPAIALGLEPPEKDIMERKPRSSKESIFSDGLARLIVLRGVLLSISTLAVFVSIMHFTEQIDLARTGGFVTLVITQLIHVFECKSEKKSIFEINPLNNIFLVLAVICSAIMVLSVVYIPVLQPIFKTVPLTWNEWILVFGFSALGPVGSSFFRRNKWKTRR